MDDDMPRARPLRRRRRENAEGGRRHYHKVGVTPEEGGALSRIAAAQHVSVPRLLVEAALSSERRETPTERRAAMAELFTLHRLLAAVSNNVNQIAKVANSTGEVSADLRATLDAVRRTADSIDDVIDRLGAS